MQNLTMTVPGQEPYTTDINGLVKAVKQAHELQNGNLPIPVNPQGPIYRCGVTVNDVAMDHINRQIVDVIRKLHYELGLQEHQFPDADSMVINLTQAAEQDMLNTLEANRIMSGGILEHIDDYYPAISANIRDPEILNYIVGKYSEFLHTMANALQPALNVIINMGYYPTAVEKFTINSTASYYLLTGELGSLL